VAKRPNGQWRARYRDDAGKEHARHFARKVDAQQWLDQVTAAQVRGDYVDPAAGRITVKTYAHRWQAVQVSSEGTARIVDNALRLHLIPALGHRPIGSVRRSDVQGFVKLLQAKEFGRTRGGEARRLSAGHVRHIYDVTAQLFAAAVEDRIIASSPCRKITLPKDDKGEIEPLSVEQVVALVEAFPKRYRAATITLAGSGLRVGELLALDVADVDFLRRTIRVERQRTQSGAFAPVKSKASRRTVPVGAVVIDQLAAHLAAFPSKDALLPDELRRPIGYTAWKRLFQRAAAAAGVEATTHDLRHFFASALIAGGASVKQVQTVLGHSSAVITQRTYAHLWPGDEDRTRKVMDAALGPLSTAADSLRTEAASRH
jgi:integrase